MAILLVKKFLAYLLCGSHEVSVNPRDRRKRGQVQVQRKDSVSTGRSRKIFQLHDCLPQGPLKQPETKVLIP